jgi:hypothetical protein
MSFFSSRSMRRIFTFLAVTVSASAAQKACTPPQREPFARLVSSIAGNFTPLEFGPSGMRVTFEASTPVS